jgi:TM2 domain-containing membrane protein YozV
MAFVYCRNCGRQISDQADVCVGCGVSTHRPLNVPSFNHVPRPEPKNSGLAILFTVLFPGAGHLYIGKTDKGTPFIIANAIGFVMAFTLILFPVSFIIWLVTLLMTAPNMSSEVAEVNARAGF